MIAWQRRHGRHDLPWQGTRDPYRVWLSEVMLQQTQVSTVLRYYPAFLARFPDVAALAAAPLDDVLAAWSGLGYYSRARHLWHCARVVVSQHGGRFPTSSVALAALPGIGRSTAAAIAAFCFGERAAILDGNVKRVLARVLGFGEDLARPVHERALWALAESLLPASARGIEAYTQGLMDLGATVCLARAPRCDACPLAAACVARREGRPQAYPVKTRARRRARRESHWLWVEHRGRLWLQRRPEPGVWAGLWCLPVLDDAQALGSIVAGWPGQGESLQPVDHALTHFDWRLHPVRWALPGRLAATRLAAVEARLRSTGDGRWVDVAEAADLGMPAPLRRLIAPGSRGPAVVRP
ncbi:MAG: A/G-specific adenine glycosylase [Ideonella sp.]|nr:A/G-specific adenine glycosylase [Ideonella sp.]